MKEILQFNPVQACGPYPETTDHLMDSLKLLAERADYYRSLPWWVRLLWRCHIRTLEVQFWLDSERRLHRTRFHM